MKTNSFRFLAVVFFMLICSAGKAQEYKHGVGAQLNVFSFKESYTTPAGSFNPVGSLVVPGIVYKAGLSLYTSKLRHLTISLASYPFLGFNLNSQTGGNLGFEVPLLAEFFYGDIDYFGGFIGVGGSFSYTAETTFGNGMVIGPQIEGGVQFPIMERVVALKMAYTYGLNDPGVKEFPDRVYTKSDRGLFSVGLVYVFGY